MKFGWENERDRLARFAKIPPVKKLEWLRQMNEFTRKFLPKSVKKIWPGLREAR